MPIPSAKDFLAFWDKIRLQMWEFASHDINPTWMRSPDGMNYARELSKVWNQLNAIERSIVQDQQDNNLQGQENNMQTREPEATQYPLTVETSNGPCTVLRHRQIYQHIQLKLTWHDLDVVDFTWMTLADNCEDNFELCDEARMGESKRRAMRDVAKRWKDHWERISRG